MPTIYYVFVTEGMRLSKAGLIPEAVVSLKNALACRDCSFSQGIELRSIIHAMIREHLGRK